MDEPHDQPDPTDPSPMGSVSLGGEEPAPLEPEAEQPQFSKMLAPLTASLGEMGGVSFVQEIIDLSGGLIRTKGQALALLIGFIALSLGLTYFIEIGRAHV